MCGQSVIFKVAILCRGRFMSVSTVECGQWDFESSSTLYLGVDLCL